MAERKIGERVYRYDRREGAEGLRLLLRALKVLVPARQLIELIAGDDETRERLEADALLHAVQAMDVEATYSLMIDLVRETRENGRLIEDTFGVMGREEIAEVAIFALHVEFGSFLAEGPGAVIRKALAIRPPEGGAHTAAPHAG